jgi:carbon dioxide concentrating mechanism protein CcmO
VSAVDPNLALGLIEIGSWTASLAAIDAAEKAADIRLIQIELNDMLGASAKIVGEVAAVRAALDTAEAMARSLNASVIVSAINRPHSETGKLVPLAEEFNPLIEQNVLHVPKETTMADANAPYAIGIIETQGFTAVIEAVDAACKAANVEIAGREKLGGGYISVVIKGDVAAVKAAVEVAKGRVEGLGKLIAAHVIARPSAAVLSLLPK